MKYRHDEILDLFDNINCIEDVQALAAAMHEYPEMFCYTQKYGRLLLVYADLFINEMKS